MAFAVKYRLEIATLEGTVEKIDISEDGYAGSIINLKGGANPIRYIKGQKGQEKNKTIIPTKLEFTVYSETDFAYTALSGFEEQTFLVEYYQGASKVFSGWLLPDEYQENYIEPPYTVTFIATDYLAQLKGINFLTTINFIPNQPYTGRESILFFIKEALLKTGLSLNIKENINIYSTQMTTAAGDSPLVQGTIDASVFSPENQVLDAYSVLEFCLKNFSARLVQDGNCWYIEQINEKQNTTYIERTYNSAGAYQSQETVTPLKKFTRPFVAETRRLLRGGTLDSDQDLKDVSIYYQQTQGQGSDVIRGFSNGSDWVDANTLEDWTLVGSSSVVRVTANWQENEFAARINGKVSSLGSASYLESDIILVAATPSFLGTVSFGYRINATSITTKGSRAYFQAELRATSSANVYYFTQANGGAWFANDVKILYHDTKKYNQWFNAEFTLPPIPEDGELILRLYQVVETGAGLGDVQNIQFTKFGLVITSQPEQSTAWLVNRMFFNERVTFTGRKEIVLIGDGPGPGTPGGVQVGGNIATNWARRGVTEARTLIQMYLQLWANLYQKVAFRLQAELRLDGGVTLNWRNTFADQDSVSTRKYFFSYYEWNPRFNTLAFEGVEYIPGDATVTFEQFTRDDLERLRWDLFPNIPFNPFPGLIPEVPTFTIPNLSGDVINEIGANSVSPAVVTTKNPIDYTGITSDDVALNVVEVTNEDTELFQTTATDLFTQWDTKATPIAADTFVISDSEDGGKLKKIAGISPTQLLQAGATTGQVLKWDGAKWAPAAESGSKWTDGTYTTNGVNSFSGIIRDSFVTIGQNTLATNFDVDSAARLLVKGRQSKNSGDFFSHFLVRSGTNENIIRARNNQIQFFDNITITEGNISSNTGMAMALDGVYVLSTQGTSILFGGNNAFQTGAGSTNIGFKVFYNNGASRYEILMLLPTSDPLLAGVLWRDGNDVKISTG